MTGSRISIAAVVVLLGACGGSDAASATDTDGTSGAGTTAAGSTTVATSEDETGASTTEDGPTTGAEQAATRRVFITSGVFSGNFVKQGPGSDGVDGADHLCAAAATGAGLDGVWAAWVSTSLVDAGTRLPAATRWVLLDETTQVFADRTAVQFGPEHAIDRTENGDVLPMGTTVWTNTDRFGSNSSDGQTDACADWTGEVGIAAVGVVFDAALSGNGLSWTDTKLPQGCGDLLHLYCFEV